jgi:cytidyltransferase-like protein
MIGEFMTELDNNAIIIGLFNVVALIMPSNYYFLNAVLYSLLISDLIVSKMAKKDLFPGFLIIMAIGLFSPYIAIIVPLIYISIIIQVAFYLRIPIIDAQTRIFVSGYYDGFHEGHINSLRLAKEHGTKLVVGVHSDKDSVKYKNKKPMNSIGERVKKVEECKYVDEIIVDCEQIFDREFMERNQIDYIGVSDEYIYIDGKIHESYEYAKSIDRIVLIPRTPGISSTQLRQQLEKNQ